MIAPGADRFPDVEMFALIGETLRRLRRDKGLTLEELGKAAELGRGQLSRIENSRQEATLSTLAKILGSQGVSRREFFRRYDLVESEALNVERQGAGAAAAGEGNWPQEIQDVLSRVESFVDATLHQPRPVAQGAFEVGDLVVLFRVVPKGAEPQPPRKPGEEPAGAAPSKAKPAGSRPAKPRPAGKRKR
jgi:transcriptional regulator with XRE-family HTH domain